jgi:hypothetical protein
MPTNSIVLTAARAYAIIAFFTTKTNAIFR